MTWLPTGAFVRRNENLAAHEGPIYWSPMTIAETTPFRGRTFLLRGARQWSKAGSGRESLFITSGSYRRKKGKVDIHGRVEVLA